ncbi:MAG: hypothetical protein KM310_00855 [Clostridiales bacterium]|nr:hypothetical protein [Clostridiales bacterium]
MPEDKKVDRHPDGDTITFEEPVEVVGNTLVVTQIHTAYAHNQHIVEVYGKVLKDAGDLILTLQDTNGKALQSTFANVEHVEPTDGEWLEFWHRLVEDVLPLREDIDEGVVVFELRKDGHVTRGKLLVPLKKPPTE